MKSVLITFDQAYYEHLYGILNGRSDNCPINK